MKCHYKHDCLNCPLKECIFDTESRQEYIDELFKAQDKERHAKYYAENRETRLEYQKQYDSEHREEKLEKQKKRDKERDRKTYSKNQYLARKTEFQEKNRQQYQKHKEKRKKASDDYYWQHREEILAKRKEKRLRDKNRENKSLDRQSEKLELGCSPTV